MIAAILLMTIATPPATCPAAQMASSLNQAVGQTLTSVRGGNATRLLAQMSPRGVAFGAEGGIVPYASLADQFARKRGHYCDLFACSGQAGRLNGFFNSGKMDRNLDARGGRATVVLNSRTPKELDLGYAYTTTCTWELTSIGTL